MVQDRFEVVFVKERELLEEVKYLRGRVFFGHDKKDEDEFDEFCDHLAVIDKISKKVIGSYRLLLGSAAKKHIGFYSETEFDLKNIKKNCKGELLEMSRACVLPVYRKYPIINLLWRELFSYFAEHKITYIFGCPSIERPSPEIIGKLFKFFKEKYFAPSQFTVYPLKDKIYNFTRDIESYSQKEIVKILPSLMRGYLKMGATICAEPAWDSKFGTADFFMMLDVKDTNARYKKRFV
jgi:putative hemolysin